MSLVHANGKIVSAWESAAGRENSPDTKEKPAWGGNATVLSLAVGIFSRLLQMPMPKTTIPKETVRHLEIHAPFHTRAF